MKTCSKCKITQPKHNFNLDKCRKDGLTVYCKVCIKEYSQKSRNYYDKEYRNANAAKWKRENPQKVRKHWIKSTYNLSWEDYEFLFTSQKGACKLCKTPLKLHAGIEHGIEVAVVDHDHLTGSVRGLLCTHCNTALGLFKDSAEVLQNAVNYIELSKEK